MAKTTTSHVIRALRSGPSSFAIWQAESPERRVVVSNMMESGALLMTDGQMVVNITFTTWQRAMHARAHLVSNGNAVLEDALCGARASEWMPGKLDKPECPACRKIAINKSQS